MIYIILFVFIVLWVVSVCFRLIITNPHHVVRYGMKDLYKYLRYKQWNNLKTGKLVAFVGLFGKGKTLSAVHTVVSDIYNKFNDKMVFDFSRMKWVRQRVYVLSNVDLFIPHDKFTGLAQMVQLADSMKEYDAENDTLTCIIVLGDEFSVQLNSRSFKTNIDPLFLNTLLTCRHHHISLYYTTQRFNHVDALLRQVTSYVITCNKKWRFMVHEMYDAYQLEQATDTSLVRPMKRFGWFIHDRDYDAYDTLACVGNLTKSCKEGDMLSEEEILLRIADNGVQMEGVTTPSKKYIKMSRRKRK